MDIGTELKMIMEMQKQQEEDEKEGLKEKYFKEFRSGLTTDDVTKKYNDRKKRVAQYFLLYEQHIGRKYRHMTAKREKMNKNIELARKYMEQGKKRKEIAKLLGVSTSAFDRYAKIIKGEKIA